MASNAHNSNQPIVIESDNKSDQAPAMPEPDRASLQDAMNSASKEVLARTLLRICEHNTASRELATVLLLPPLAPTVPQGTKRRASPAEVTDRTYECCGRQFSNRRPVLRESEYHPGELFAGGFKSIVELV